MSPLGVSVTVDAIQTAAIITLIVVICFLVARSDKRFNQLHADTQDVIRSQYRILKEISDNRGKIDTLDEKLARFDGRVRKLEG